MTTDDTDIVSVLRRALADKVGKDRFELWFGASPRLELSGDRLTISTPNPLFQDWLRTAFRSRIEAVCLETLGRRVEIEFRVDPAVAERAAESGRPGAGKEGEKGRKGEGENGRKGRSVSPSPLLPCSSSPGPHPPPPASRRRPLDLDSFVPGRCNRLARTAAEMVIDRPGEFSPLVVHGRTGVGKTHLLQAICNTARAAQPGMGAIYLSAEQFMAGFVEAVRGSGLPSFRQKCRGVGLLLIDDLQFLSGKKGTQVELLYTMDTIAREGRQMVFAADRPPAELQELGHELCTRLLSGLVCRIDPAEYETRLAILDQMARRKKLVVPPDVCRFIAARLTSHARELSGAICRLEAVSRVLERPIDLAMAEESLDDLVRQSVRLVRLPDIEKAVCAAFGLEPKSLQSAAKAKRISHPRMLAMWLARKYTRAALSEIGLYFGRRSHSTVISAHKRIEDWLAAGKPVELASRLCAVEEAIQEVERLLAT